MGERISQYPKPGQTDIVLELPGFVDNRTNPLCLTIHRHTPNHPPRARGAVRVNQPASGVSLGSGDSVDCGVRAAFQALKRRCSDRTDFDSIAQRDPLPGVSVELTFASCLKNLRSVRASVSNRWAISFGVSVAIVSIPFVVRSFVLIAVDEMIMPCPRSLVKDYFCLVIPDYSAISP